jgi:predicted choloylglycine hydrolase
LKALTEVDKNLLYLESSGSFKEIGENFGKLLTDQIQDKISTSLKIVDKKYKADRIQSSVERLKTSFQRYYPYLWEEIAGICSGANVDILHFLIHIFRPGIHVFNETDDGCSDIIFPRSNDGPILGKCHDATSPEAGLVVVRRILCQEMNPILCVTQPDGMSSMNGMNNKGLAVGEASIHFHTTNESGTVRNLLIRPILHECDNVNEAVEFLADHPPVTAGFHFSLVDQSGTAAIVERSPTEQNVRWSKGESIFCTNHSATPLMRLLEKSRGPEGDQNSDIRYRNIKKITAENGFEQSLNSLKEVLAYHHEKGGICQHGDPDYKGEKIFYPMFTQRAFINIIAEGKLLIANDAPCSTEFLEFNLNRDKSNNVT